MGPAVRRMYGDLCHICKHGGARQVDHLIAVTERPDLEFELSNLRPAHGSPGNPCKICSKAAGQPVYCNQVRGWGSVERAQRIIAERSGSKPKRKAPPRDAGREW